MSCFSLITFNCNVTILVKKQTVQKQLLDFPPLNALQDCFGADCMLSTWGSVILRLGHEVLRVSRLGVDTDVQLTVPFAFKY